MTRTPRSRRPASLVAAASAAALLGALLPVTLVAAPAQAANGCLTEVVTGRGPLGFPAGSRCDDQVPPSVTSLKVTPAPNPAGLVNTDSLTFTYVGEHTDTDADRIGFECKFWPFDADSDGEVETAERTEPSQWTACGDADDGPASFSFSDLGDTGAVPYTFKVRAFDIGDRGETATNPTNPLLGTGGAETDLPDEQDGFSTKTVRIDTRAPTPLIFNVPFDSLSPTLPMLTTDSPTFTLSASEGSVTYSCDIDGRDFDCQDGKTTFKRLRPGTQTLSVTATDAAGNTATAPATTRFTVPADIELPDGRAWRKVRSDKAFGGSYFETDRFGAKFSVSGTDVREVRLIATKRPGAGILKYKTPGNPNWAKVKLNSQQIERSTVIVLRNRSSKSFTGAMKFRTYSRGKLVAVDAIMLR